MILLSEPDGRLLPVFTKGSPWTVWHAHHPPVRGGHNQSGPVPVCVDTGIPPGQSPPTLGDQDC